MEQQIDSTSEPELFEPAARAIVEWERILGTTATTLAEILRLKEELEAISNEERDLLTDASSNESVVAKRLNETRAKKELKLVKLESAKRNLGSDGAVLSPKLVSDLESEAARLQADIKVLSEREREIFAGGEVKVGHRLLGVRKERDEKVAAHETILNRLSEHKDAVIFRPNHAGKEARQELHTLIERLIRKREAEVDRLVDILCVDHKGCGSGLTSHFRSVREASRLRLRSCSDPSEARALFEQISAMWELEPLGKLLEVASQESETLA
jgi:uncharacterized protein (UPF0335 family)